MQLTQQEIQHITEQCNNNRKELITLLYKIQTGHPGGSLSSTEIITLLYEKYITNEENRNKFILSKGHAAPMLYINLMNKGYFSKDELYTLRQAGSRLQGHPCMHKLSSIDASTGPLGLGLSVGIGMALSNELDSNDRYTFVLLGDGEIQEGSIWEAAMTASKYNPKNLITILDNNGVQLDGDNDTIMPLGSVCDKFTAFGWSVLTCDGHNVEELYNTIEKAKEIKDKPVMIVCKTVKGKGISFMEGKYEWHGKPIDSNSYKTAMEELEKNI